MVDLNYLAEVRGSAPTSPKKSVGLCCLGKKHHGAELKNGSCMKIFRSNGKANKILLYPEEGWARSASSSYWSLQPLWWCRNKFKVIEVSGTRRQSTNAKIVASGSRAVFIVGSFSRMTNDADFKLYLTTNVTQADQNMGYIMTGTLERGCLKTNSFQTTHFAVMRRFEPRITTLPPQQHHGKKFD